MKHAVLKQADQRSSRIRPLQKILILNLNYRDVIAWNCNRVYKRVLFCNWNFKTNKQTKTTYEIRNNKSRKYGLLFLLAGYITLSHVFTCSLATHPKKTTQNIGKHSRKNTSTEKTINIKKKWANWIRSMLTLGPKYVLNFFLTFCIISATAFQCKKVLILHASIKTQKSVKSKEMSTVINLFNPRLEFCGFWKFHSETRTKWTPSELLSLLASAWYSMSGFIHCATMVNL